MIMIKEKNIYYLFLLFVVVSPFIHYTSIFILLESLCLILLLVLNKKIVLKRKNRVLSYFYLIPLVICLFGYNSATSIGTGIKFLLSIIIIMQFEGINEYFDTAKKYFNIICNILIGSIIFEMFFKSLFFEIFTPVFNFLIGKSGTEMIYSNALKGIYYGFIPDSATSVGILVIALSFIVAQSKYSIKDYMRSTLIFICILLTSKRGPMLFASISFAIIFCKGRYSSVNFKRIIQSVLILVLLIAIIIIIYPKLSVDKGLGKLINTVIAWRSQEQDVTSGREDLSEFALQLFYQNKIWGIGWGKFSGLYKQATNIDVLNVHNVYIQLLCEVGIVGCAIVLLPFIRWLKIFIKYKGNNQKDVYILRVGLFFLIFNLLYMLTGCFFDMPFYYLNLLLLINFINTEKDKGNLMGTPISNSKLSG